MFDGLKSYYTDFEMNTMQPHQQRVVTEKKELDDKIDKLKAFIIESPTFKKLPEDERDRLAQQNIA
jgi:hypothetical protein